MVTRMCWVNLSCSVVIMPLGHPEYTFVSVGKWPTWKTQNHNLSYTNESKEERPSQSILICLSLLKLTYHDNKIQHINSCNVFNCATSIPSSKRMNPWSPVDQFLIWLIGIYLLRSERPWMYNMEQFTITSGLSISSRLSLFVTLGMH